MIGEAVEVTVLEVQDDRVRLRVLDPSTVPSHREELLSPGEPVALSGHVSTKVIRVEGSKVRLGITAPREVVVRRKEVAWKTEP